MACSAKISGHRYNRGKNKGGTVDYKNLPNPLTRIQHICAKRDDELRLQMFWFDCQLRVWYLTELAIYPFGAEELLVGEPIASEVCPSCGMCPTKR